MFSFLGIPPLLSKIEPSDEHETEKTIPVEHQLNEKMKQRLMDYYRPFDQLLQQLITHVYSTNYTLPQSSLSMQSRELTVDAITG